MLGAKEEPRLAARTDRGAFLKKSAERRDSGTGPDHDDRDVAILRKMKFRFAWKDRRRRVRAALGEERRANAFSQPAVTFVCDDVDDEVHRLRERLQAGGSGIEPRLQFGEQTNELGRLESDRGMLDQEIDDPHAPEIGVEFLFAFRIEQLVEERRGGRPLGDGAQESRSRLGDAVIAEKRFAESGRCSLVVGYDFVARRAKSEEDFFDQIGPICRINRDRLAHFVAQTRPLQGKFEVPNFFF